MLISGRIFFHFAIFLSTLPGLDEPAEAEEEVGEDEQQGKKTTNILNLLTHTYV